MKMSFDDVLNEWKYFGDPTFIPVQNPNRRATSLFRRGFFGKSQMLRQVTLFQQDMGVLVSVLYSTLHIECVVVI